jgi:hypothetical protein
MIFLAPILSKRTKRNVHSRHALVRECAGSGGKIPEPIPGVDPRRVVGKHVKMTTLKSLYEQPWRWKKRKGASKDRFTYLTGTRMIDIHAIVDVIRQDAASFRSAWCEETRRWGPGAIVILPPGKSSDDTEVEFEYWTVEEIRSTLRALQREDEFVYRWIDQCEREGGLPVMVLAPSGEDPATYYLAFHRFDAPPD